MLYTSNYLKQSFNQNRSKGFSTVNETTVFDIFLSHSALDKEEVLGLYYELTNMGYKVYVDWIVDPQLDRNNVTKVTAEKIRQRMKSSRSVLLAFSVNAALSKWIPWELGYIDGNTSRCSLVPVSSDNVVRRAYERREYLLLYPYIKREDLGEINSLFVIRSAYEYDRLSNWIITGQVTNKLKNIELL